MKLTSKQYTGKQLMNPARPYVNADHTDLKATFERIRAEQAKPQKPVNVRQLRGKS